MPCRHAVHGRLHKSRHQSQASTSFTRHFWTPARWHKCAAQPGDGMDARHQGRRAVHELEAQIGLLFDPATPNGKLHARPAGIDLRTSPCTRADTPAFDDVIPPDVAGWGHRPNSGAAGGEPVRRGRFDPGSGRRANRSGSGGADESKCAPRGSASSAAAGRPLLPGGRPAAGSPPCIATINAFVGRTRHGRVVSHGTAAGRPCPAALHV